jgi:hypothetical protein
VTTDVPAGSAARAVAVTTGHPALKLVLLTVAAVPGWPAADDVARAAELPDDWTRDALAELTRLGHLVCHRESTPARYSLAALDGWGFTSDRDGDVLDTPDIPKVDPARVAGYAFGSRRVVR